mmetsp:Transcript_18705/g.36381  ORF Transcript_18705/g.36381 Transcript_18705/m.36381 type:complete len:442 (+) Transcript_18705:167-1492(+)
MNPLMFISYRLCQSASSSFAVTSRAIKPSLALTSSDSDNSMQSSTLSWALDNFKMIAASGLYLTSSLSSPWWLLPMISRMQDSRMSIMSSSVMPSPAPSSMNIRRKDVARVEDRQESMKKRRRAHPTTTSSASSKATKKLTMSRQVSDASDDTPIVSCSSQNEHAKEISLTSSVLANLSKGLSSWAQSSAVTTSVHETNNKAQQVSPDRTPSAASPSKEITPLQLQQDQCNSKSIKSGHYPLRRVNSNDWVKDYKKERIDKINFNNVFGGIGDASSNEIPVLPEPHEMDQSKFHETVMPTSKSRCIQSSSSPSSPSSASSSAQSSPVHSSSSLPASVSITQPTPADVICGRGGKANSHPGNVNFRAEALKLRSWYESSSKSEKFTISSLLVDFVREKGGRFLKRDAERPGNWLEADGNDVRKKASQALREGRKSSNTLSGK